MLLVTEELSKLMFGLEPILLMSSVLVSVLLPDCIGPDRYFAVRKCLCLLGNGNLFFYRLALMSNGSCVAVGASF